MGSGVCKVGRHVEKAKPSCYVDNSYTFTNSVWNFVISELDKITHSSATSKGKQHSNNFQPYIAQTRFMNPLKKDPKWARNQALPRQGNL